MKGDVYAGLGALISGNGCVDQREALLHASRVAAGEARRDTFADDLDDGAGSIGVCRGNGGGFAEADEAGIRVDADENVKAGAGGTAGDHRRAQ